ncbi:MAG: Uma2 family endonuclease [Hyphomicrobiales bacterium]|nr:Uma2 family endonuclease [Hyphomicrobiales bacterium]
MIGTAQRQAPRLSIELFRAFYATRPEEERWQLIDGAAVMMTPPTKAHQRIASNLERLLNDALERHQPVLAAYQRLGVDLAPAVEDYDPEPDVLVIDADTGEPSQERYVERFYLAAEVVSSSDRIWVERKREIYKLHESCKYVLSIEQDRYHVRIDTRTQAGWIARILITPDAMIELADFGLRCTVADLYRGTALQPRSAPPQ